MSPENGTETRLSVDRPGEGERPTVRGLVVVEGWAWAPEGPPHVAVTVGDRPAEVVPGAWRPDVSAALGIGELRGYVATASAAGIPPGPLDVIATATGSDGITVETRRTIEVTPADGSATRPRPWAGFVERLDPKIAPGGVTHAEHVARYRWAAQLADGREVLDAGCGVGFGARILHEAGALRVTGVDAFAGAIVEAREQARDGLEFAIGDLRELPLESASFDYVVCFEAIEHIAEQRRVMSEIKRVLRPGGLLAISTPIPGAITVHNAHHVAERTPAELEALLRETFANVELHRQFTALASLIDNDTGGRPAADPPPLRWTTGPTELLYVVALASDAELPANRPLGALAAGYDVGALVSRAYEVVDELAQTRADAGANRARADRAEFAFHASERRIEETLLELTAWQRRTEEAERRTEDAERRTEEAERRTEETLLELTAWQRRTEEAERRTEEAERRSEEAENAAAVVTESHSWTLTRPLRAGAEKARAVARRRRR